MPFPCHYTDFGSLLLALSKNTSQGSVALLSNRTFLLLLNFLLLGYEEFRDIVKLEFHHWSDDSLKNSNPSTVVLTLLTLRAFALARLISGVSGMMWMEVLSLSQTSLYFGYGKNQQQITSQFLILPVKRHMFNPSFGSHPDYFHIKPKIFKIFSI